MRCTPTQCAAARPERCVPCNTRRLFEGTKTVDIVSPVDGERAATVRVIWRDGSFFDHPVTENDR